MQCELHPEKKAVAVCMGCSKSLCEDCKVIYNGKNICKDCEQKLIEMSNNSRSNNRNSNSDSIEDIIEELANRASSGKKQLEQLIKDEGLDEGFKKILDNTNIRIFGLMENFEDKITKKERFPGYLICDECNGYYELQKGESLEDFESCECGGSLIFKKKLDG
ncbi:MAG: hypothetical protein WCF28_05460 [Methanobacterium sp.]|uniref:hypothetical protein n=1 Tax=Methanobacterium sp. TaxID=2164 RepID=UPI003C72FA90